jgi:hypothetical protein
MSAEGNSRTIVCGEVQPCQTLSNTVESYSLSRATSHCVLTVDTSLCATFCARACAVKTFWLVMNVLPAEVPKTLCGNLQLVDRSTMSLVQSFGTSLIGSGHLSLSSHEEWSLIQGRHTIVDDSEPIASVADVGPSTLHTHTSEPA